MNRISIIALFALGLIPIAYSQSYSQQLFVGIMEDDRTELVNWKKGPSQNRVILPLFEKKQDEWMPSTSQPEQVQWTIAFDGKNSGNIRSQSNTRKAQIYTYIHIPIAQQGQSLTFGKASEDFSGWQNTLVNRPLVLTSNGSFKDPDGWKPGLITKEETKLVRSAFRAEYSKVRNCDKHEMPLPNPWPYKDSDIKISKLYRSNIGELLVGMHLEGGQCGVNGGPFQLQLFFIKSDKSSVHIKVDSKKRQLNESDEDDLSLILVDAGDYDGDGKSEVIFFVSGYNEDGYAMFYDSFQKNVFTTWSYH